MFKSLLQTIPTLSGNFSLACHLDQYNFVNYKTYKTYISNAEIIPLDNNLTLNKKINVNLVNSNYETDVNRYFREISSWFYKDTYAINKDIFEEYNFETKLDIKDDHDKNFEFGCNRLSYHKYNYQFIFYAPIYVNEITDLPKYFQINIYNDKNYLFKTINIPIGLNHGLNKLRIYLIKYIDKLKNNIPILWQFKKNVITYQNALDCKNGCLINFNSYNVIDSNNINNIYINDIDYMISSGYMNNNLILSECIPLSFMFNLEDICSKEELYYIHFNNLLITGQYVDLDDNYNVTNKYDFYNFSTNYHYNYITHNLINLETQTYNKYYINYFNNNVLYSNNEGLNEVLKYSNTVTKKYCQFKLFESEDYIINCAHIFNYNNKHQFPIQKNIIDKTLYGLLINENLIINKDDYINRFDEVHQTLYQIYFNNNYLNWFEVINPNILKLYTEDNSSNNTFEFREYLNNLKTWVPIINHQAFKNGILYNIPNDDVKYFNIFVNPILINNDQKKLFVNVIKKLNNETLSNKYYQKIEPDILPGPTGYLKNTNTVYVLDNSNLIYLKYDDIYNLFSIEEDQIKNKYGISFSIILNILQKHFNIEDKFIQLPITNQNISKSFLSDVINNTQYQMNIYYSSNNLIEKKPLYNEMVKFNFDYDSLLNIEHITFYYKNQFINIFDFKYLLSDIIYPLYNGILQQYSSFDNNLDNSYIFNDLQQLTNIVEIELQNIIDDFSIDLLENIVLNNFMNISNEYIYSEIRNILIIYIQLLKYKERLQNYRYIEYYNDNNIVINNDYLIKLNHFNDEYYELFIDPNISKYNLIGSIKSSDLVERYITINNIDEFNYWKNNYYNQDLCIIEGYNVGETSGLGESELNNIFNIMPKYAKLDEYIKHYIKLYYPEYNHIDISLKNIIESIDPIFLNGICTWNIPVDYDHPENLLSINVQLCFKTKLIKYTKEFYDLYIKDKPENTFLIYKEINQNQYYTITNDLYDIIVDDDNNKITLFDKFDFNNLVKPTFNTYYLTSEFKYTYNSVNQNIRLIKDSLSNQEIYVYNQPFNLLKEINSEKVTEDMYDSVYQPINQDKIELEFQSFEEYYYILINYYIYNSSISFNIQNIDENNIYLINSINDIPLNEETLWTMFKNIYPYLKQDILLFIYDNTEDIIKPNQVTVNYKYINKKISDKSEYSLLYEQSNNYIYKQNMVRYFGNIDPYFIKVDYIIPNEYTKIFIDTNIVKNKNYDLDKIKQNNKNFKVSNINIYQPRYTTYISKINKDLSIELSETLPIEFKHFNNSSLFILPINIKFSHYGIDSLILEELNIYKTKDKCFEYFDYFIKQNFNNYSQLSDLEKKFIFNKYDIVYEENIISYNFHTKQKLYTINYNLTLL